MEILALLPSLIVLWATLKIFKRVWRVLALLFLAAFINGCASTTESMSKSPCACDFQKLNADSYEESRHA